MTLHSLFFWQPHTDYLKKLIATFRGKELLIFLNYGIWPFLFFVSYLLIKNDTNIFWQILFATIVAEIVEKFIKSKVFWKRPMFLRQDPVPPGLVKKWYETGSFPSGHTTKAVFFGLFLLQYGLFHPSYLFIVLPLLLFRVLVGFHYPIDVLGGIAIGTTTWLLVRFIQMPEVLNNLVRVIFNFVFLIH